MHRSGQLVRAITHSTKRGRAVLNKTARRSKGTAASSSRTLDRIFPDHEDFSTRHIGPNSEEIQPMLDLVGVKVSWLVLLII